MTQGDAVIDFLAGRDAAKHAVDIGGNGAFDLERGPTAFGAGRLDGEPAEVALARKGSRRELRLDQAGGRERRQAGQQGTAGKIGDVREGIVHGRELLSTRYIE